VKLTEEAEELGKLKATLHNIPKRENKRMNETEEILKLENRRMEQIESERRKLEESRKKLACWQRYFCCCCYENEESYRKLE
jgi:hypothetical protein